MRLLGKDDNSKLYPYPRSKLYFYISVEVDSWIVGLDRNAIQ